MYQIARKIRYVLRWAGILAGGLIIAAGTFAALLPILVDAEAIRGTLSRELISLERRPGVNCGAASDRQLRRPFR